MVVEARSATLESLIDPTAELTSLGGDFLFTEGPVWSPGEGCLYFSDIPTDARWRWSESQGMELVMKPCFKANGLVLDRDGNLIVCEQLSSTVARFTRGGTRELLAYHHEGRYLNSPNDIVVRTSDGSIYFTDPDYGRWNDVIGAKRSRDLGFKGVYRVATDGTGRAELVVAKDEFDQPNGLCFSPDETLLYIDDSSRAQIKVFDVRPDGSLDNPRLLFAGIGPGIRPGGESDLEARHRELHNSGAVDGMKCDENGNVWVTGPGGIWIISPQGEHLGVLRTPEVAGNLTWGGSDLQSLFLMTSTTVHVVRTHVRPAPLAHH